MNNKTIWLRILGTPSRTLYLSLTPSGAIQAETLWFDYSYKLESGIYKAGSSSTHNGFSWHFEPIPEYTVDHFVRYELEPGQIYRVKLDDDRLRLMKKEEADKHRIMRCLSCLDISEVQWTRKEWVEYDLNPPQETSEREFISDAPEVDVSDPVSIKIRDATFLIVRNKRAERGFAIVKDRKVDMSTLVSYAYSGSENWNQCH